jgi:ubiquinone/menaquinone biosynthesis C-methylase UbiE
MPNSQLFNSVAQAYSVFRPQYPPALFSWLANQVPARARVWDCGCGNGQASTALAEHFEAVVATDASAQQIAAAVAHPRVNYHVSSAEDSGLPASSCDLITVAQALHWFDVERFYRETRRVLRPGGLLAAWTYTLPVISSAALQAQFEWFYHEIVGPYWPPERRHVETRYAELDFPQPQLTVPHFGLTTEWTLPHLLGYVSSWSATARCRAARGSEPVAVLAKALSELWPPEPSVQVEWPLTVLASRMPS